MKLTEEVSYLHEELPFQKQMKPIDKAIDDKDVSDYDLSQFHDSLLNMLKRYPKKKNEVNRRLKSIEAILKKVV